MSFNLAPLQNLIDHFERMQGIGHKTAQRMAFYILGLSESEARDFARAITDAHTKIKQCKVCCDLADDDLCPVCKSNTRDKSVICVVEDQTLLRLSAPTSITVHTMCSTAQFLRWIISDLTKSESKNLLQDSVTIRLKRL